MKKRLSFFSVRNALITLCCLNQFVHGWAFAVHCNRLWRTNRQGGVSIRHSLCTRYSRLHHANFHMYFDDASRKTDFSIPGIPRAYGNISQGTKRGTGLSDTDLKGLSNDKLEALNRMLIGHDVNSAAVLSEEEVHTEIVEWAEESGLVGKKWGDEVYDTIESVHICHASSVIGCIAELWATAVHTISEKTFDESGHAVVLIVMPNCEEMFCYKSMFKVHTMINFCANTCAYFGKSFELTHFHPRYKGRPKMLNPRRHSPFPSFGLHLSDSKDEQEERLSWLHGEKKKKSDIKNESLVRGDWAVKHASILEDMYNSAAASSLNYDRNTEDVIDLTAKWIEDARNYTLATAKKEPFDDKKPVVSNKALQFVDSVHIWKVIHSKVEEELYAMIWKVISELDVLGEFECEDKRHGIEKFDPETSIVSGMIVLTSFNIYQADAFKKFAISISASLSHITKEQMFLEVFHPEFVGRTGSSDHLRRSPYPMLQVCNRYGRRKPV